MMAFVPKSQFNNILYYKKYKDNIFMQISFFFNPIFYLQQEQHNSLPKYTSLFNKPFMLHTLAIDKQCHTCFHFSEIFFFVKQFFAWRGV